jgi:hypothetical protein
VPLRRDVPRGVIQTRWRFSGQFEARLVGSPAPHCRWRSAGYRAAEASGRRSGHSGLLPRHRVVPTPGQIRADGGTRQGLAPLGSRGIFLGVARRRGLLTGTTAMDLRCRDQLSLGLDGETEPVQQVGGACKSSSA